MGIFNCDNLSSIDEFYEKQQTSIVGKELKSNSDVENVPNHPSLNIPTPSLIPINKEFSRNSFSITPSMFSSCVLLRILYDMALDKYNVSRKRNISSSKNNRNLHKSPTI